MRALLVLALLTVSSVSYAGSKSRVLGFVTRSAVQNTEVASSKSIATEIVRGLEKIESKKIKIPFTSNQTIAHRRVQADNSELRLVTGSFDSKDGVKKYYLNIEAKGYSDLELSTLEKELNLVGTRVKGIKRYEIDLKDGLRNANDLDQRILQIGKSVEKLYTRTDAQKNMVAEVILSRSQVYGTAGAN